MDTSLGSIGGANNNIAAAANNINLSPSQGAATTNNLINGLSSLGLQSLQNNHFNRNEIQVRSSTLLFMGEGDIILIRRHWLAKNTCYRLRILNTCSQALRERIVICDPPLDLDKLLAICGLPPWVLNLHFKHRAIYLERSSSLEYE